MYASTSFNLVGVDDLYSLYKLAATDRTFLLADISFGFLALSGLNETKN